MKDIIKYYYSIYIDEINYNNDFYFIKSDNDCYIFKKIVYNVDDLKNIINELNNNNIKHHEIVLNKDYDIITTYNDNKYVLIKLLEDYKEVIKNPFLVIVNKEVNNISKLWEDKLNFYDKQLKELGLYKYNIKNTYFYFRGLAENAIAIYNKYIVYIDNISFSINHRRVSYTNYCINYYDPTNMIIDFKGRDLAEYVKNKFFYNNINIDEFIMLIKKYKFNNTEINLLYSRLLYPSYYFDLFDDMIISEDDSMKIDHIYNKVNEFELFLYDVYKQLSIDYDIIQIDWLKK